MVISDKPRLNFLLYIFIIIKILKKVSYRKTWVGFGFINKVELGTFFYGYE